MISSEGEQWGRYKPRYFNPPVAGKQWLLWKNSPLGCWRLVVTRDHCVKIDAMNQESNQQPDHHEGFIWIYMVIYGYIWIYIYMDIYGYRWLYTVPIASPFYPHLRWFNPHTLSMKPHLKVVESPLTITFVASNMLSFQFQLPSDKTCFAETNPLMKFEFSDEKLHSFIGCSGFSQPCFTAEGYVLFLTCWSYLFSSLSTTLAGSSRPDT